MHEPYEEQVSNIDNMPSLFKTEVIADDSGKWAGNGMEFKDFESAEKYVKELADKWLSVRKGRVLEFWKGPGGHMQVCIKEVWP